MLRLKDSLFDLQKAIGDAKALGEDVSDYEGKMSTIKPSVEMLEITGDDRQIERINAEIQDLIKIIKTNKK